MPRAARVREVGRMAEAEADRLARENLWRCRALARRLTRHRPRLEDEAESVALVGLADAVRVFVPDRGRRRPVDDQFAVFAHVVIGRHISNYLYRGEVPKGYRRRAGGPLPRPVAPGLVSTSALAAGPLGVDAAPPVGRDAEWEDLVLALSRFLPGRRGELFRRHYLRAGGESLRDVAREMGLGRHYAHQVHREALAMLRANPAARRLLYA